MQLPWLSSIDKSAKPASAALPRPIWDRWLPIIGFGVFILAWELVVRIGNIQPIFMPSPEMVAIKAVRVIADGTLFRNTGITLVEVLGGLTLGFSVATVLGYSLAKKVAWEQTLTPYLVASQAVPVVAIAPLLVLWFGYGLMSKVIVSALIVFFPILINTIAGLRSVPAELHDMMRSLRATRWQIFWKLEVPAAMSVLLAGLKIGATLSVIGAVVGEMVGSNGGLGNMVSIANGQYDTARMFVGVFALIAMALTLYGTVSLIERRALAWRK